MAFDVLVLDGKDLRGLPLEERLAQLDRLPNLNKVAGIALLPSFDDGEALMLGYRRRCFQETGRALPLWPRPNLVEIQDADLAAGQ
jgi:hypothetical protein